VSADQDALYAPVDAVALVLAQRSRMMRRAGATYRLLSSERHWLLYASTLTSLRKDGAAKSCTLIFPAVMVSPATTEPVHAESDSSSVDKGIRRLLNIISAACSNDFARGRLLFRAKRELGGRGEVGVTASSADVQPAMGRRSWWMTAGRWVRCRCGWAG
jgi:hypothetical protein